MTKVLSLLLIALLTLVGCAGSEFSNVDSISDAGDTGDAGEGGGSSGGRASGGSSTTGGRQTGGSTSEGGLGGESDTGGSSSAGQGGSQAGQGGSSTAGKGGMSSGGTGGSQAGQGGSNPSTGGSGQGGISSTGGMTATGGSGPVMICNPKATQCSNGSFETCTNDGSAWTSQMCDFVCDAKKGCVGKCQPGEKQCEGTSSQTCDETGSWVTTETCPFVCSGAGVCGGSCVPGTDSCQGTNASRCNASGAWTTKEACAFVCSLSGGVSSCAGSCTNGSKQCNGKTPQTCTNGTWTNGAACDYLCTGSGSCTGVCTPGAVRCGSGGGIENCSSLGQWGTEGSACPFLCSNGACAGVCVPNGACPDDGNACTNDVCNATGTACQHPNKTNGTSCGSAAASSCTAADSCQAGVCQPNNKPVGTSCDSDQNVCTANVCSTEGVCVITAAPAATQCRAASCTNGSTVTAATCGGATDCPAAVPTSCNGACASNGLTCEAPGITKMVDSFLTLAVDNDATYLYASIKPSGGAAQIVRYTKSNNAALVLYQSTDTSKWIYSMIVAGSSIYFSETIGNAGEVRMINTTGVGQLSTLVDNHATFGFAKNSTRVYWSDMTQTACACSSPPSVHIYSTAIGSASPTTFSKAFNEISTDIEVDDQNLYIWNLAQSSGILYTPSLTQYALSNAAATGLVNGYFNVGTTPYYVTSTSSAMPGLTKNSTAVFANVNVAGTSPGSGGPYFAIFKVLGGTMSVVTQTSPVGLTNIFAASASTIYIDNMEIPVAGGTQSYFVPHQLSSLTLDGSSAYFGSYGYWTSLPYSGTPQVVSRAIYKAPLN